MSGSLRRVQTGHGLSGNLFKAPQVISVCASIGTTAPGKDSKEMKISGNQSHANLYRGLPPRALRLRPAEGQGDLAGAERHLPQDRLVCQTRPTPIPQGIVGPPGAQVSDRWREKQMVLLLL